jgi:hypothetical protein
VTCKYTPEMAALDAMFRNRDSLLETLRAFDQIYAQRPLRFNPGGLCHAGALNLFLALSRFPNATTVIESGVWKGGSTWIIEKALPRLTNLYCLDPNVENTSERTWWHHLVLQKKTRLQYRSKVARYATTDFLNYDWHLTDPTSTIVFFDDHQDVLPRLIRCRELGLKTIILDDNYDSHLGDHQTTFTLTPEERALLGDYSLFVFPRYFADNPVLESVWSERDLVPAWVAPYLCDSNTNYMFFSLLQLA